MGKRSTCPAILWQRQTERREELNLRCRVVLGIECQEMMCKLSSPKICGFRRLSRFLCTGGLGMVWWVVFAQRSLRGCHLHVGWAAVSLTFGEGSASKLTHMVVRNAQFFPGYWTEGLSYSLAVGWRLPSVSCFVGLCIGHLPHGSCFMRGS